MPKPTEFDKPSEAVLAAMRKTSDVLIENGFNLGEASALIRGVVPVNYDKTKDKSYISGLLALYQIKKPNHNLSKISALVMKAKGVIGAIIQESHEMFQRNMIRNQGGGWVQGDEFRSLYRVVLYSEKDCCDINGPDLLETIRKAFAMLKLELPEFLK